MSARRPTESAEDLGYFRTIEAIFLHLRGAPLLLAPADYQVARAWRRAGIPLEVVADALRELFEKRRERGTERRVNSLRYCRSAVERAWQRAEGLRASGGRGAVEALDPAPRLVRLAEALPVDLAARERLAAEIRDLEGPVEVIEARLAELDGALLEAARDGLSAAEAEEIAAAAAGRLAELAGRLGAEGLDDLRRRLEGRELRRRRSLPLLSLFSPDAEAPE